MYKIEAISRKEIPEGKFGPTTMVGIKINGEWYNGFDSKGTTNNWTEGTEINNIELFDKPKPDGSGVFKNWKFVSQASSIEALIRDIEELKSRVQKLEDSKMSSDIRAPF